MDEAPATCPFCSRVLKRDVAAESAGAAAIPDAFPLSPGHMLVVPKRHVADWFELTKAEQAEVMELANEMQRRGTAERAPDGWNIGINVGAAGGQTVGHVHLHLNPRHNGDREDPRGGVRWVIPERAAYWDR